MWSSKHQATIKQWATITIKSSLNGPLYLTLIKNVLWVSNVQREKNVFSLELTTEACSSLYQRRRAAASCVSTASDGPLNDAVFL